MTHHDTMISPFLDGSTSNFHYEVTIHWNLLHPPPSAWLAAAAAARARSGRFLADDFVRGEGSAQTWPPLGEILGKSGRKCGMNDMP